MSWDKGQPAGTNFVPDVDDNIRTNNDALETALNLEHDFSTAGGQTGKHKFPTGTTAERPAASLAGRAYFNTETHTIERDTGTSWESFVGIPSGTKMVFYQDTAPTGWTIQNTLDDKLLLITKGSVAGGLAGGSYTGSWTISGATVTVAGHTLTIAEIPPHTHTYTFKSTTGGSDAGGDANSIVNTTYNTGSTGGGGSHSHGATFSQDGTWRPAAYTAIICSKD